MTPTTNRYLSEINDGATPTVSIASPDSTNDEEGIESQEARRLEAMAERDRLMGERDFLMLLVEEQEQIIKEQTQRFVEAETYSSASEPAARLREAMTERERLMAERERLNALVEEVEQRLDDLAAEEDVGEAQQQGAQDEDIIQEAEAPRSEDPSVRRSFPDELPPLNLRQLIAALHFEEDVGEAPGSDLEENDEDNDEDSGEDDREDDDEDEEDDEEAAADVGQQQGAQDEDVGRFSNPGMAWACSRRGDVQRALRLRGFPNGLPININFPFNVVPQESTPAEIIKIAASLLGIRLNTDTLTRLNALGQQALQEHLREALSIIEPFRLGMLECDSSLCEILSGVFRVQLPQGTPHAIVLQFEFSDDSDSPPYVTLFSVLIRGGRNKTDLLLPAKEGKAYIFGPPIRNYAQRGEETEVMKNLKNYLWPLPDRNGRRQNRARFRQDFEGAYYIFRDDMGN